MSDPMITVRDLKKHFRVVRRHRTAVRAMRALLRPEERFAERTVLHGLDFDVATGDRVALVGSNGSGKTTLLRILSGIYRPSGGQITLGQSARPLFSYSIGLAGELSVEENVYLFGALHEMDRPYLDPRLDRVIERAGLQSHRHTQLKQLSAGQRQRLALSVFFESPAELVIFDEALANVDQGFLQECDRYFLDLSDSKRTLLLTSHDPSLLSRYCRTALWLDDGRIRHSGPVDEVLAAYGRSFDESQR